MASRATDHGGNRGRDPTFAMRSRSWRLVPQIMGKSWKRSSYCDEEQIVASRATDHGEIVEEIQLLR